MERFLDNRAADLRWAIRAIRRSPATSAVAVLSLALGIGANTAIFSIVNALQLRALPVRSPQELVVLGLSTPDRGLWDARTSWNYPDYVAFRDGMRARASLAAVSGVQALGVQIGEHAARSRAELAQGQFVAGNYFDLLGVTPALGRLFNAADDRAFGAAPWAVLSYDYWRARFAGDPRVVGQSIRVNGYPLTVIGVARRGFAGTDPTTAANIYMPMVMHGEVQGVPLGVWNTRHYWWFRVIGRVPDPKNVAALETQLLNIYREQEEAERRTNPRMGQVNKGQRLVLLPGARGFSWSRRVLEKPLLVLMIVVGVVLLIACANVANVMLARGAGRQRELAVRMAVGAARSDLVLQLLTEGLVIGVLGGVAGIALAYASVGPLLANFVPEAGWTEVHLDVSPDLAVLAFTAVVSLLTGTLAAVAPAMQATRPALVPALKDDSPGSAGTSRLLLRRLLVVAQVALSLLLLVGAALFARSLANLRGLEAGFAREHVVIAFVEPDRNGYKGQRSREFYERLLESVARLPGVRSASLAAITPLGGSRWNGDFAVEGYQWKPDDEHYVDMNAVGPRYFETMGIPLVLGRDFTEQDSPAFTPDPPERLTREPAPELPGPRYLIVNEAFAKRFFGGGSPIGRRVALAEKYDASRAYEVVGVVKDVRYFGLKEKLEPMLYVPAWRGGMSQRRLCIRTAGEVTGLTDAIRRSVSAIDPAVPLLGTKTIAQEIDRDILQERLIATLVSLFGVLALLLAAVGLYGVISFLVTRRTREIGIRLALGAQRSRVLRLVMGDAARMVGIGAVIGVATALGLGRLVRSLLYGVSPQDPMTMAAGVVVLLLVAALAVLVPVRRALAVQPSEALRYE